MTQSFTERGYPGNEDSGAMSSFYVFSAMGFFPNAGQNFYYLIGPIFSKIKLHLSNGKVLVISAPKVSEKNIYVRSIKINGEKWHSAKITYDVISKGGQIEFDMTDKVK